MKVDNTTNNSQQVIVTPLRTERPEGQTAARENQAVDASTKSQPRKDNVEFSPAAERLNKAKEFLKDLPDTRPDRVQELKGQLETGQYDVKAKDVAAKMLNVMKNSYAG